MPELVYNVKFEIDNASLQKVSQVTTGITNAGGGGGGGRNDAVKQARDELRLLAKDAEIATKELRGTSNEFREFSTASNQAAERLDVFVSELPEAIALLEGLADSTELSNYQQLQVKNAISSAVTALNNGTKANQRYAISQQLAAETAELVTENAVRMNASFSTSNQVLFSLSDGLQDASQFSYGFASGMRAIGNNVGFTAELMSNLQRRVKEFNESGRGTTTVTQELVNSLKGPGGVLIAINLVVTAFTVVSREIEKYKKKTEEATGATDDFSRSIDGVLGALQQFGAFEGDIFGVERSSVALDIVNSQLARAQESFFTDEDQSRLNNAMREQSSILKFISVNGEMIRNQRYDELQAEIDILQAKKQSSVSQERIDYLTQRQLELQTDIGIQIGVANDERVLAQKREQELQKQTEENNKKAIEYLEERKLMEENLLLLRQASIDAESNAEQMRALRLQKIKEDEAALMNLFLNPPKPDVDEPDESRLIKEALDREKELQKSKQQTVDLVLQAGLAQFLNNKQLSIATALIDTYVAAQKAYASQLVIGDPTSIARAQQAAIFSVAQGLARVALLRSIQPDGSGGGSGSAGGSAPSGGFGFRSTNVEGPQTFRTPSFTPSGQDSQPKIFIANKVVADRKQLYVLNKLGEEEYRQIKV